MKTRNIIMIIAVALIFVVATVLTIVGIVTHKEPIFMDDAKSWDRNAFPLLVRGTRYTSVGDAELEAHLLELAGADSAGVLCELNHV